MSKSHCPRFDQGLEVPFGKISISRRGIRSSSLAHGEKTLSWNAIRSYAVTNGTLMIQTKSGESFCLPTGRIPNLAVLLHAFEQLAPQNGTKGTAVRLAAEEQLVFEI
jgi:hypothetical protein